MAVGRTAWNNVQRRGMGSRSKTRTHGKQRLRCFLSQDPVQKSNHTTSSVRRRWTCESYCDKKLYFTIHLYDYILLVTCDHFHRFLVGQLNFGCGYTIQMDALTFGTRPSHGHGFRPPVSEGQLPVSASKLLGCPGLRNFLHHIRTWPQTFSPSAKHQPTTLSFNTTNAERHTRYSTHISSHNAQCAAPRAIMAVGTNPPRSAPRGPAASRRRAAGRTDRDGDLKMDVTGKGRAARGGISKSTPPPAKGGDLLSRSSGRSGTKASLASGSARSAILRRAAASGDISMNDTRSPAGSRVGSLAELKITGWKNSKAADSADGGVSALVSWIEKKASNRLGSRARAVKVKKVCYHQHSADCRPHPPAAISGPPSFAANLRTTTAIQVLGQRLPDG